MLTAKRIIIFIGREDTMLGLYIHIPFCNNICPYCDFYKMVASNNLKNKYIDALLAEMKLKKLDNYKFDTLYIGGGTPTSLTLDQLERLFLYIKNNLNLDCLKEFTIEVNPGDLTSDLIDLFVKYGISRVSIGVQTFNPRLQEIIKRPFSFDELKAKIDTLKEKNINNINLDLIYSIPTETVEEFDQDLDKAISLDVTHLSVYSLILEEHTIFYHKYLKGELELIDDKLESKMYHHLCNKLSQNNFIHYETSNFSKKGYQSFHNLIYWNCDEYLAVGASSASYFSNYRNTNIRNIGKYIESINNGEIALSESNYISKEEAMEEFIIFGLRKTKGISKNEFALRFDEKIKDTYLSIQTLIDEGLLKENRNYIYIPQKYFYISNHIIVKILSE